MEGDGHRCQIAVGPTAASIAVRVAIVNQPFDGILPPGQNSIGIWTYHVARALAQRHEVSVFGRHMRYLRRDGISKVHRLDSVTYVFSFAGPLRVWTRIAAVWNRVLPARRPIYASVLYYLEYSLLTAIRIRRHRPDVIHLHNMTGFVPVVRACNPGARIVLHMSCEWLTQLDERMMDRRISQVDAVFGCSEYITGLIRQRFPHHAGRCHTVVNGVDLEAFVVDADRHDHETAVVAFVGRVSPEKGVHDLIAAMSDVAQRVPDVRLDVIGPVGALARSFIVDVSDDPLVADLARFYERDYGDTLAELANACPAGTVRFLGSQSHDDVVALVKAADVLVNPSYSESFGMSIVEALACETPVVATRVGGMPEVVGDDAGVLVERNDQRSLADAIVRLLDDADLRRRMGRAGRSRVEAHFAWKSVAERVEQIYTAITEAPAQPT